MGLLELSFPKEVDNLSEENGFEEKQTKKQRNKISMRAKYFAMDMFLKYRSVKQ